MCVCLFVCVCFLSCVTAQDNYVSDLFDDCIIKAVKYKVVWNGKRRKRRKKQWMKKQERKSRVDWITDD